MKKIKFKFEYVPLSDEQVERHKNFDQLLAAYTLHPKPSWKSRLFGNKFLIYTAGIITGVAVTASMWWGISQFNNQIVVKNKKNSNQQLQFDSSSQDVSSNQNLALNEKSSLEASTDSNKSGSKIASSEKSVKEDQQIGSSATTSSDNKKKLPSSSDKNISQNDNSAETVKSFAIAEGATSENRKLQESDQQKNESQKAQQVADEFKLPTSASSQGDSITSLKKTFDTLSYIEGIVYSDSDFIPTPTDSLSKKKLIDLSKIDVSDEWNPSKNAVSKFADSVGNKTSFFFTRIFKSDSSKKLKVTDSNSLAAKDQLQDSFKHRFAQVTFVSPIGSDGMDAKKYMHNISFNILQGYNGAVNGFELGGLANVDSGYMTGVQIAGIANHILGDVKGVQIGGLYSSGHNLSGFQTGGLVSVATGSVHGVQVAGVTNLSSDTLNGLQIGGVINLSIGKNYSHSWQIAGVSNVSSSKSTGGQISGVFNYSYQRTGIQVATINFAMRLKGFQLGVINLSDTIDGDALGVISISRNGQHHVDLFGGEILYSSVGIKLGTPHVYNIFAAGVAPRKDTVRLGFGFGIGGHIPISEKVFMNIDGICWTIHDNNLRDWEEVNLWNEIRLTPGFQFTKGMAAYIGPTLNVQVYDARYSAIAPYTIYESHNSTTLVDGWIGLVVGLQFF